MAAELATFLRREGLESWVAGQQLEPGQDWRESVERALEAAQAVILLVGPEPPSDTVRSEWSMVLESLWDDKEGKVLLPLVLDDAPLPPFLRGHQTLHFSSDAVDAGSFAEVAAQLKQGYEGAGEGSEPDEDDYSALFKRVESAISELEREESDDEVLQGNRDALQAYLQRLENSSDLDPGSLAVSSSALGMLDVALGDYGSAKSAFESALDAYRKSEEVSEGELAPIYNALGKSLMLLGDSEAAAAKFEQGLDLQGGFDPDSPAAAATLYNLGTALCQSEEFARAVPILEKSLGITKQVLGELHPTVKAIALTLGHALLEAGDAEAARTVYSELGDQAEDDVMLADTSFGLGKALRQLGDVEQSREVLEKSLQASRTAYGDDDFKVAGVAYQLALSQEELGRSAEAVELYELALRGAAEQGNATGVANILLGLGIALRRRGDVPASIIRFEQALGLLEKSASDRGTEADVYYQLAISLRESGDLPRADECLRRAIELGRLVYGNDHPRVGKYERASLRLSATEPGA
jgi:tetratricopeptide (TPR) repeat protein